MFCQGASQQGIKRWQLTRNRNVGQWPIEANFLVLGYIFLTDIKPLKYLILNKALHFIIFSDIAQSLYVILH